MALKPDTKKGTHRDGDGVRKSLEPKVTAHQRLQQFPGQGYKVIAGLLYCPACKLNLPLITSHGLTAKHAHRVSRKEC